MTEVICIRKDLFMDKDTHLCNLKIMLVAEIDFSLEFDGYFSKGHTFV